MHIAQILYEIMFLYQTLVKTMLHIKKIFAILERSSSHFAMKSSINGWV